MTTRCGYTGKILKIDLTSGKTGEIPTKHYADRLIGGRGIAAGIYWDEVPPGVRAFDPENILIFITGPLAGLPGLAGSRLQICGKSPAIDPETFGYANLGGSWGAHLKFAGWDGLVVQGKSDSPVFLFIRDNTFELRTASDIWGKDSVETREILKKKLGSSVRVLSAGIAGENLVPFATILADDDASGSGGFGAVMGSKNLKAIAVFGNNKINVSDHARLRELTKYLRGLVKGRRITPPTLSEPPFPSRKSRKACFGCIAGCLRMTFEADNGDKGKFMCQQSGMYIEPAMQYYKKWTEVPFKASRLCDKYGLDTMVLQPLIEWLHSCGNAGILTDDETDIPISRFGSLEFIESVIKKISLREGFGDILAEGIVKAADFIGKGSDGLIGDLIFPGTGEGWVYDPRMFITTGLFYATEPKRPIQHLHEISWLIAQWVAWVNGDEKAYVSGDVVRRVAERFWGSEKAADFSTYEGKALAAKKIQDRQYVKESLILCDYAWPIAHSRSAEGHLGDPSVESKIYSAVVGRDMDEEGLYETGERIFNLQRAILVREGHRGKNSDILPEFNYSVPLKFTIHNPECLVPGKEGKPITRKGEVVDRSEFDKMRNEYYGLRGWDTSSGLQTVLKLNQLGLYDVSQYLAEKKLAVSPA